MIAQKIKFKTIDEYISTYPKEIQLLLKNLRSIIKKAAPDSKEKISYNMPAFEQSGVLVYFAACKHHIGFYPTANPINVFKEELTPYKTSKGDIQLPIDKPLPVKLITKIVKFRIDECLNKKK